MATIGEKRRASQPRVGDLGLVRNRDDRRRLSCQSIDRRRRPMNAAAITDRAAQ
jgi:hypothetical protein